MSKIPERAASPKETAEKVLQGHLLAEKIHETFFDGKGVDDHVQLFAVSMLAAIISTEFANTEEEAQDVLGAMFEVAKKGLSDGYKSKIHIPVRQ